MKSVLYTRTLREEGMTAIDKIVYCQIAYYDLCGGQPHNGHISLEDYAMSANVSRRQLYYSKNTLTAKGYLDNDGHAVPLSDNDGRYFELLAESCLSGVALILYSYIAHLCKKYGWVDRRHSALAKDLCMSEKTINNALTRLYESGHILRQRKGKQTLLSVNLP